MQTKPIASGEELERVSRLVEPLLKKGETRTPEENALCELLLKLIDDYQEQHTIIPELPAHELLQALLDEAGQRVLPVVIQTEEEYDRIDAEIGSLLKKGHSQLVPEERALLELLTKLIEDYDAQHYSFPKDQPHESAQPAPSLSGEGLDEFMADLETLAEGTEHLPPSTLTYSRPNIYFDHD